MNHTKRNNYLLVGWIVLLIFVASSLYLYLFRFDATVYFWATLPSRSVGEILSGKIPDNYELEDVIVRYKRPVFFFQFASIVLLFVYTKVIRRILNLIIISIVYWVALLLTVFFALLTLLMPIIPYGGMVG